MEDLAQFLDNDESPNARTLFIGNIDTKVTRKLLYELMIQVGPVESIRIVPAREGQAKTFCFVVFEHAASVRYAMLIFQDISLFRSRVSLNYSGAHKNKPKTAFPPYGPTFFQDPPGFEALSEQVKSTLLQAQVIPPPDYKTGYYVPTTSDLPNSTALQSSGLGYVFQNQRDEHGMPLTKQIRGDPAFSPDPRNGYSGHTQERNGYNGFVQQRNGGYEYPGNQPVNHPYGQYPPANSPSQSPQYFYPSTDSQLEQQALSQYPGYGYAPGVFIPTPGQPQRPQQQQFQRSFSNQTSPYQYQARPQVPYFSPPGQWR